MIFPSFPARGLIDEIVLPWFWRKQRGPGNNVKFDQVGCLIVASDGGREIDDALAQFDASIAVHESKASQQAVKAPESNRWPKIRIVFAKVDGRVAE